MILPTFQGTHTNQNSKPKSLSRKNGKSCHHKNVRCYMRITGKRKHHHVLRRGTRSTVRGIPAGLQSSICQTAILPSHIKAVIFEMKRCLDDLLELAVSNKCSGDLSWLSGDVVHKRKTTEEMPEKEKLDSEGQSAGLQYRDPPAPKDRNCKFDAVSGQLIRLGLTLKTQSELRSSVVQHLRNNPLTSDGIHLREFVSYQTWDRCLRKMSQDGVWGDWITLWGLVNMLNIDIAVVSSLGEGNLRIISTGDKSNTDHNLNQPALQGHEAKSHYYSLDSVVTPASTEKGEDLVEYVRPRGNLPKVQ